MFSLKSLESTIMVKGYGPTKPIVGEIYHISKANEKKGLERYNLMLDKITRINQRDVIIRIDQNFDFF